MSIANTPLTGFLKTKMQWHHTRQQVLSENVANADTPRFRPQDLKPILPGEERLALTLPGVGTARTHQAHIAGKPLSDDKGQFGGKAGTDFEVTPEGNAVVLEDQMMKVAENQFDFQAASALYSRQLGLIKTALGKQA